MTIQQSRASDIAKVFNLTDRIDYKFIGFPLLLFKQHSYLNQYSCNIPLPPEPVYGIHVQYECNRIEFLLS